MAGTGAEGGPSSWWCRLPRTYDSESCQFRGDQAKGPTSGNQAKVAQAADQEIERQLALIEDLPAAVEPPELIVLPDTNALIQDPAMESWVLGDKPATIVIAQEVVSELDRKKVEGNASVAAKADGLIRRLNEYGRRGDTLVGVNLAGRLRLRELALAPDMSLMPEGLDPTHSDDRILATCLWASAQHLTSRVVLVTRDRNLRNKARLYGMPAVDVADL
jgi:rRNA-processing protein FCF1